MTPLSKKLETIVPNSVCSGPETRRKTDYRPSGMPVPWGPRRTSISLPRRGSWKTSRCSTSIGRWAGWRRRSLYKTINPSSKSHPPVRLPKGFPFQAPQTSHGHSATESPLDPHGCSFLDVSSQIRLFNPLVDSTGANDGAKSHIPCENVVRSGRHLDSRIALQRLKWRDSCERGVRRLFPIADFGDTLES